MTLELFAWFIVVQCAFNCFILWLIKDHWRQTNNTFDRLIGLQDHVISWIGDATEKMNVR